MSVFMISILHQKSGVALYTGIFYEEIKNHAFLATDCTTIHR